MHFWKPLPYFTPKYVIFPTLISDLTQTVIPYFRPAPDPIFCLHKHLRTASNSQCWSNLNSLEKKINKKIAACKNHIRSHIRVHKTHPISDQNGQHLNPIADQKGSKTIPFGATHNFLAYIREYPPPPRSYPEQRLLGQCLFLRGNR